MNAKHLSMWTVLTLACGSDPAGAAADSTGNDDDPSTTNISTADTSVGTQPSTDPGESSGDSGATTAPGSTGVDSSSSDDAGFLFDLGGTPDMPPVSKEGCTKIDFLFVIDNSGSMSAQQAQLLNSFGGFITAIGDSLDDVDSIHLGVITSDNYTGNAPGCTSIGDLVTQTSGFGAANMVCTPFDHEGDRFASEDDDLAVKFPCMAQVGTSGSAIEQPVTGLIAALDPAKAESGACNEGFLRDDAILVVVIVTDDPPMDFDMDDAHPATDTSGWYDAVLDAKNGDEEAVVMIGFIPWFNVGCNGGAESPNLIEFV
ncbi:MAG: hypothetical protein IAG13_35245, partial [Deltaproteobacteria bacterium]|nr:hypothetical protein [Nannocystaceae bacterium]